MTDELPGDYEITADYVVSDDALPTPRMHFAAAFLFGSWYSIILAAAMSFGVRYLYRSSPAYHVILQAVAWALGSGMATAVASRLSKTHRLAVGVCSTLVTVSTWIALLVFLRGDLDESTGQNVFGHPISIGAFVSLLSLLTLIAGLAGAFQGARSREYEELTTQLLVIPSRHWLWLWIAAAFWVSMLPVVAYFVWLMVATSLYATVHPSLWFGVGTDLFFGFIGIAALFKGIEMSLTAVSEKSSSGRLVWKRVLVFLAGSLVLASVLAPLLLNLDIDRLKDMPASLGAHPWWVL